MGQRIIPIDQNGFPIQALAYGTTVSLAFTGTTDRVGLPMGEPGMEDVLRLAANEGCFIKFGDSTVVATSADVFFPGGVETVKVPDGTEYIAAIQDQLSGTITITEMN